MIPETEKISDDDVAFAKERVNEMATRYHAWDLSDNDAAALRTLLSKIEEQERELVRLRSPVTGELPKTHWPIDSPDPDKKQRMFKVTREDDSGSWIARDMASVQDAEFDGAETGDKITIELIEMTERELDALPEFAGW